MDGSVDAQTTASAMESRTPHANLKIGAYVGGIYTFNGTIDEVAIFSRALSAEEINASYNAGLLSFERLGALLDLFGKIFN